MPVVVVVISRLIDGRVKVSDDLAVSVDVAVHSRLTAHEVRFQNL